MSFSSNIAYWFGAGASRNALPIVGEMNEAFLIQPHWLHGLVGGSHVSTAQIVDYGNKLKALGENAKRYGTIDTYARALYLLKKQNELAELKLHLAMFFLLEQAVENKLPYKAGRQNPYDKPDRIDTRYMTWLAQLIDTNKTLLPSVKIVSWNYDLQIEHALGLYYGMSQLGELHHHPGGRVFPYPVGEHRPMKEGPSVIHLNGIAGQAITNGSLRLLYDDIHVASEQSYIKNLFDLYKDYDKREQHMLNAMMRTMTFAWEEEQIARESIECATRVFTDANTLVIIGYSFPPFNRTIDMHLINNFRNSNRSMLQNGKRIIIQSPSMQKETFCEIFNIPKNDPAIVVNVSVEQFYLPPELFTNK